MGNGSAASFAGTPNAFDTATPQGVQDFARHYPSALQLLLSMASDYAAARCLLMNGHFPGLELGARAIEKALKAFLLFDNPTRKVRSHSLPQLVNEVAALHPRLNLLQFMPQLQRFRSHFQARYPDSPDGSKCMSTAELEPLDEILVF
jgi:HEPN domain-containing protein